ncbi:MAG: flagellar assembly protein FliW [Fusobacteriota bacterium]
MKIQTTRFGNIEINKDEIIYFEDGILGFEDIKKYVIFEMEDSNPLMWMQAVNEPSLAFVIIRPFEFRKNYTLNLSDKDTEELELESAQNTDIFSIVVVPDDPSKMTANLQGPIVINTKKNIGRQVISTNSKHKLKHYIIKEMQEKKEHDQRGQ